jgi:hypothetical protein
MQGWRVFKEDTTNIINSPQPGNNPTNKTVVDTYQRDVPTRGRLPYTRFSLHTLLHKRLDFTGRFIYTSGTTNYTYFDNLTGTNKDGRPVTSDAITVLGDAKRPHAIGDLSATFAATHWLRISNSFRYQNFRINGGDIFNQVTQVPTAQPPVTVTDRREFATTNYRRFVNTLEGDVDLSKRLSFHLGYRFTDRHIQQLQQSITPGQTPSVTGPEVFDNQTHTFIAGFKAMENIFVLTGGGPLKATHTIGLEVWTNAFMFLKFGYATAAAWVMGAILIGFTVIQIKNLMNMRFGTAKL